MKGDFRWDQCNTNQKTLPMKGSAVIITKSYAGRRIITPGHPYGGTDCILKGYAPRNAIHWQGRGRVLMLAEAVRARS
jgi:hypothetical protein